MYFEARVSNQNSYKVIVEENRSAWVIKYCRVETDPDGNPLPGQKENWVERVFDRAHFTVAKDGHISLLMDNVSYILDTVKYGTDYEVYTRGSHRTVSIVNDEILLRESIRGRGGIGNMGNLKAGMPGKIVNILVKEGDHVNPGDPLLIMEAMKMENEMRASKEAIVDHIFVKVGDNVETGAQLISFKNV